MRLLFVLFLALCVVPAFGQGFFHNGNSCQTTVRLEIPAWAQVDCQDSDGITFSDNNVTGDPSDDGSNNGGGDFWCEILDGTYKDIASGKLSEGGCDSKASTDPWAGAEYITGDNDGYPSGIYYEALDYAHHYVRTNTDIQGQVTLFDKLSDGNGNEIPAWFTLGFAPFWDNGEQIDTGAPLPFDGEGGYLNTENATSGTLKDHMSGLPAKSLNSAVYNLTAPAFGTISLHARILRKGMMDVSGTYTGTVTITYN